MGKKKPLLKGLFWSGILTFTATVSGLVGMSVALKTPLPFNLEDVTSRILGMKELGLQSLWRPSLKQPLNILVLGVDLNRNYPSDSPERFNSRSDTILLVRLNPDGKTVQMLSIPRDSRMRFPEGNHNKVNSANATGGIDLTQQVLRDNLNGVTVDKYARITTDAFQELVDALGGVTVDVPINMKYTDQTQGLFIDLQKGEQVLNGDQAEQFVRYRESNFGDIGRVERQQILLKAMGEKLQSPMILFKFPQIFHIVEKNLDTNLTKQELFSLVSFAVGLKSENISTEILPGQPSAPRQYRTSYWLISESEKDGVMEKFK
ncbi:MAG: LCP family protein [Cyanobacterium sp. T60_A2020_053]|nr:LCP family protein [Cyanobacterium sp. T60_A2020_053]